MFEYYMPAPGHYLWHRLSVLHPLRLPFADNELLFSGPGSLSPGPVLFYQPVFLIKHFPSVAYPDLVYGFGHKLLDMKPVIDKPGCRETSSNRKHHGCRQVGGHCLYLAASINSDLLQYLAYRIRGYTPYHGYETAFTAVSRLVGKNRIDLTVTQTCLVKTEVFTDVLREDNVFFRMPLLVPVAVVAYLLFVLLAKRLSVEPEPLPKALYAYRTVLNLPLLKKPRTLR